MSYLLQSDRLQRTDLAKLGACLTHGSPSIVKHTRRDAVERLYVSINYLFFLNGTDRWKTLTTKLNSGSFSGRERLTNRVVSMLV